MIQMKDARKKYDGFELNCSMEVKSGSIVGLIGRNGAGKSTTFKALLDLIQLDSGSVTLLGKDARQLSAADKQGIGVVFADSGFSGYLMVCDLVPILRNFYPAFEEEKFIAQCRALNLPFKKPIRQFSTGMKAKLKLIVALTHRAKLLILDEPTAGLDVIVRNELLDMLREYMEENPENTILISSHISKDLEDICDYFCFIDNGEIVLTEEMDTLLANYALLKVSAEDYARLDKAHLLRCRREAYGYCCLTNERQFYLDNYPQIVIEKSSIDDLMVMMIGGDAA